MVMVAVLSRMMQRLTYNFACFLLQRQAVVPYIVVLKMLADFSTASGENLSAPAAKIRGNQSQTQFAYCLGIIPFGYLRTLPLKLSTVFFGLQATLPRCLGNFCLATWRNRGKGIA
jgi:hypothetical protein